MVGVVAQVLRPAGQVVRGGSKFECPGYYEVEDGFGVAVRGEDWELLKWPKRHVCAT